MDQIKNIIDDIGIAAFESNIQIAGLAVISDLGKLIYQTDNFDVSKHTNSILNVFKGDQSFTFNNTEFSIVNRSNNGIVGTNKMGMGHVLFIPFQGGVLVSYAMPKADPIQAVSFLKNYSIKLNGLI
ncbi:MAG: hypothetical protein ACFFA0_01130 [Promethearchaeota archaeon]